MSRELPSKPTSLAEKQMLANQQQQALIDRRQQVQNEIYNPRLGTGFKLVPSSVYSDRNYKIGFAADGSRFGVTYPPVKEEPETQMTISNGDHREVAISSNGDENVFTQLKVEADLIADFGA